MKNHSFCIVIFELYLLFWYQKLYPIMEFESSLSSLIGKIYEDFDYFCSEAKLILPQVSN